MKKLGALLIIVLLLVSATSIYAVSSSRQSVIWPGETLYIYCHNGDLIVREYPNTTIVKCFVISNQD